MAKNILVKFHNTDATREVLGFWLADEEGLRSLLAKIEEYRTDFDWQKYPFVYDDVKYSPDGLLYNISTMIIDEDTKKFMFPRHIEEIGAGILPMFISFFTFQRQVLKH